MLRPYQSAAVTSLRDAFRAYRAVLFVLPTGGGKTVVFSTVAHGALHKGRRALIVVHRRELIRQASAKLTAAGVPHGVIAPGFETDTDARIQVASLQTIIGRLEKIGDFNLIILDEAHHARAESWKRLLDAQRNARLLGVTATPCRADGKGLGVVAAGPFEIMVLGPTTAALIADGFLAPTRCYVPANRLDLSAIRTRAGDYVASDLEQAVVAAGITGDAVRDYAQRADHQPAIAFCVSVDHAQKTAEAFRAAGYRAACVHGGLPVSDRDAAIAGLADGGIEILTACDLISEGLDVPAVAAVILLRPTKSLMLHRQQIGRGMRPAAGKMALIVNDHVGNTITHGLPEMEPKWTLAGVERPVRADPVWVCGHCGCANVPSARACDGCGEIRPRAEPAARAPIRTQDGDLVLLTADRLATVERMSYREVCNSKLSEAELKAYARACGFNPRWVQHRLREQRERSAA